MEYATISYLNMKRFL